MKSNFYLYSVVVFLALASCKKEEKTVSDEPEVPVKENFFVEMDVIANSQDDFTVYYTEDNTNAFVPTQAIWKGVSGTGAAEKLVIDLPEEVIPTNIRLDFGIKQDRKDVVLQNLKFGYNDKSFEIKGSDFFNYFILNDIVATKVDAAKGTITFLKSTTGAAGTYFGPRQELLDKIATITK